MAKNTARYFKNFSNDYVYTVGFAQNICRPGRNSTRVRRKQRLINELEPGSKNYLPDYPFKQFQFTLEWRIFYIRIKPGWRFHHRFFMTEGVEGKPSMIITCSAETSATERQMMIGEMPARVVHATAAKRYIV